MVGGRDVQHICPAFDEGLGRYAALVHGDKGAVNLVRSIYPAYLSVSGILHGVELVPAEKLDYKPVEIFRTRAHNNLPGTHTHTPE